jgi:hypothetical protein
MNGMLGSAGYATEILNSRDSIVCIQTGYGLED